jgi:hypothetical protein
MISINTFKENVANFSRSAWLASLGAVATVSQESKQIVEKLSKWNEKLSVTNLSDKYGQVLTNIKESLGTILNQMPMPKFATAS